MKTTDEILNDAADLLEKEGWIQDDWKNENGRCALKAVLESLDRAVVMKEGIISNVALRPVAALLEHIGGGGIARWNDEPGRTKEEVVEALRAAAVVAAAQSAQLQTA